MAYYMKHPMIEKDLIPLVVLVHSGRVIYSGAINMVIVFKLITLGLLLIM